MRFLLDTHLLLWTVESPARLADWLRASIQDPSNIVMFSAVNIWEIAIKSALGRSDFTAEPLAVLHESYALGFEQLPIDSEAAARVATLPLLHHDPFDRMLVAQAMVEEVPLYTVDRRLAPYSSLVRLVG